MKLRLIFAFFSFAGIQVVAWADCSSRPLLEKLKPMGGSIFACIEVDGSQFELPESKGIPHYWVIRNFQVEKNGLAGITLSLYSSKTLTPIFEETGLGEDILEFVYQGKEMRWLSVDINRDGMKELVLRTHIPPVSILLIKSYNPKSQHFESLGLKSSELEGQDFVKTDAASKVVIDTSKDAFNILTPAATFRLDKSNRFVREPAQSKDAIPSQNNRKKSKT